MAFNYSFTKNTVPGARSVLFNCEILSNWELCKRFTFTLIIFYAILNWKTNIYILYIMLLIFVSTCLLLFLAKCSQSSWLGSKKEEKQKFQEGYKKVFTPLTFRWTTDSDFYNYSTRMATHGRSIWWHFRFISCPKDFCLYCASINDWILLAMLMM